MMHAYSSALLCVTHSSAVRSVSIAWVYNNKSYADEEWDDEDEEEDQHEHGNDNWHGRPARTPVLGPGNLVALNAIPIEFHRPEF